MSLKRTLDMKLTDVGVGDDWRVGLDERNVSGLVDQLRGGRVLPPIKVRPDWSLVLGRHRLAAHFQFGAETIRADVVEYEDALSEEEDVLSENLRRRSLSTEERDRGLARLVEIEAIRRTAMAPAHAAHPSKSELTGAVAARTGDSQRTVQRAVDKQKPPKKLDVRLPDGSRCEPENPLAVEPAEDPWTSKSEPATRTTLQRLQDWVGSPRKQRAANEPPPPLEQLRQLLEEIEAQYLPHSDTRDDAGRASHAANVWLGACWAEPTARQLFERLHGMVGDMESITIAVRRASLPSGKDETLPGERKPRRGLGGRTL